MTLPPLWRNRLLATLAGLFAIWMGGSIARSEIIGPMIGCLGLGLIALSFCQPVPLSTLALGGTLVGYEIGNRGFAQILLSLGLPLFPAEACLLFVGGIQFMQWAWRRETPWRRDWLNYSLLAWMLVGGARLLPDLRAHGLVALRDFAMVYYALFFFLTQALADAPINRRFLHGSLLFAGLGLVPVYAAYLLWPEFFFNQLSFRGTPLIFFKDDLAGTFLAAAALLFFLQYEERRPRGWLLASGIAVAMTLATGNRASMLGLLGTTAFLAVRGRWRFGGVLLAAGGLFCLGSITFSAVSNHPFERTAAYRVAERAVSIVDWRGTGAYSEVNAAKADNNRFRHVWWRNVVDETLETNPFFGLGFGHDLAARFVREYQPTEADDFTARSPHSVLVTIFGRQGVVGLVAFLAVIGAMVRETWRAFRERSETSPWWAAAWTILISACFGVVLEGPMGAVVFWTLLGLAHAGRRSKPDEPAADQAPTPAPAD